MPQTRVFFYQDASGEAPVRLWLRRLRGNDPRGHEKCVARIERLAELGHELRRPEADYVREGIHELRARRGTVNYRILYCFAGRHVAVLVHALTKEGAIPPFDFQRALQRREQVLQDPRRHLHQG